MQSKNVHVGIHSVFDDENFFQVLNLEQRYEVDFARLESQYLKLFNAINSKLDASENDFEKEFLESYLSMLNRAYSVLEDDVLRAEHLLRWHDIFSLPSPDEKFLKTVMQNDHSELLKLKDSFETDLKIAFNDENYQKAAEILSKLKMIIKSLKAD